MDQPKPPTVRLRHHIDLHVVEGEGAYLVSEREVSFLEGRLAMAVSALLTDLLTPDEIVAALVNEYPAARISHAIEQLVAAGVAVLDHGGQDGSDRDAAFYEMSGLEASSAARRLATATVGVCTIGDTDSTALVEHLRSSGVGTVLQPREPMDGMAGVTLSVVLTDDYLRPDLDAVNRAALATATPWILARTVGSVVWVGPLFRPSITACWSCLAHRIVANRETYSYLQRRLGRKQPVGISSVRHQVGSAIGAGLAALEVLREITGIRVAEPSIVTTDLLTGDCRRHEVFRRPQCPSCGDGAMMAARAFEPVRFSSRAKALTSDGGHRATAPEELVERFSRQVSPITGVVTSLERVPNVPGLMHVFTAGQNAGRQQSDLRALRRGLRASSCGKGMSEIQARASAIGEAIERSSGVFQGDELRRRATIEQLGDAAIHPNRCMLFSERQYEYRDYWNLGEPGFQTVFEPFREDETIDWSPVWSVSGQRVRWLPTQYLYYGYPIEKGHLFAHADSNGCAAGTSLEDAALQGFCELVERDSVALWWYNRVRRPAIDLDSFKDAYIDRLRESYASLRREVWTLDLTSDLGIPVVGAFSRVVHGEQESILIAFGAHLDPRVALLRALTEMNQFLPAVLPAANGASPSHLPDAAFVNWCRTATLANQPYLACDPETGPRTPASWPLQATNDFAADLAHCQRLVEARGLELLVLDQTRPDVELPVVKVIVPGLRHFWPRFAPGRLFDVPVALGWCAEKTEEHLLNPLPVFI